MVRNHLMTVLLAGATLLVATCTKPKQYSASVKFLTPTDSQRLLPGVVNVKVELVLENCYADSTVFGVNGTRIGSIVLPRDTCEFTWDASNVTPGSRKRLMAGVFCIYYDAQGVTNDLFDSTSIVVLVDTGGPGVKIVSPQDGDTFVKGSVPITVWAKDTGAVEMDRVEFLIDDVLNGTVTSGERDTWRYTWDASQASATSHAIKAKAYNKNGEVAAEAITVAIRDTGSGGGPTYHHGYIDTSETWSASGNPHIVDGDVALHRGVWLTIEPGCVVKFDNFGLNIGAIDSGGLTAVGTASAPILFTSNQPAPAPGDWTGIWFGAYVMPGTHLSYCTIEYAGLHASECAAITMGGGGKVDEVSNCTIRNSGMYGVFCREYAGFGTFRENVVTANQGYALRVDAGLAEVLEAGNTLTGNDSAGVELYGRVSVSTTWPDLGVPYVIDSVTVGDSTNDPVLTIESGIEVRFRQWGELAVGVLGRNLPARIVADGVTFTSAAGSPAPGDFDRVSVYEGPSAESEFRNCNFSYGGQGGGYNGMLWIHGRSPVITGCDFGYSAGWGITLRTAQATDTLGLRAVNTFHDNVEGDIKWMHLFPGPGD